MAKQSSHAGIEIAAAVRSALPAIPQHPALYTVDQFAAAQPAFTPAALRNLIFKAEPRQSSRGEIPGNGLLECGAVVRIGRKVLIDANRFLDWVSSQQSRSGRSGLGAA